ncbi:L-serine dehydratase 2 [Luteitalea pratensis]|uniref:L-serine ammonia-lyase n=1 Tax=Luteitalea pratensis TaxID=1855912 RepID=A0A143PKJ6_LUTPR|nr:L-serine ammonia-lyase [Luteitalea pratensis]AMY09011.1 L-serine dehydratase 2 [Luteitalea pratensis]
MKDHERTEALTSWQADARVVTEGLAAVDRRAFLMRSAVTGAAAVLTGCAAPTPEQTANNPTPPPAPKVADSQVSQDLAVKKDTKGPVMTTIDEFYKVGPGPSSSHTIGPMRITYDFYQRCTKLPADQLAKATALKVHLFGSLSATGKGHGTERASLAGIVGKEPATVEPAFLDGLASNPDQTFDVKLGGTTFKASLKDIIYDAPKGNFPHPNTMTCKLMAGDQVLLEQEYYSVGGGFIEWKGYEPPKKGQPKYPYSTMKELQTHAEKNNLSIAQVVMANEVAVSGKTEAEVAAFVHKIHTAMVNIVKAGLAAPESTLPGPIKLKTKAGDVYKRAQDEKYVGQRGVGVVAAYALAGSEENARGHLVVTAPTGGSAGVMPAIVYAIGEGGRNLPDDKIRDGFLAAAAIGYLCKHNATLSGAEGGCQAEIGVASAMGAAFLAQAHDFPPQVVANAAESSLQHHLGMTCDPVAGFVQVPCIERCAFGAVKAWTGFMIASNEIPANRRVDFDTTVTAMALTAREMNGKYKETSEGGLAVSLALC